MHGLTRRGTRAIQRAGVTSESKLAVLGLDACLMNMLEIAHHFAQHAQVLVAVQSYEYADYVDLVHLTEVIRGKLPAASAAAALRTALDSVIVSAHYGENVRNSNGLSVWFSTSQQQYGEYRSKYLQLRCNAGHSGWVQFLDSYYA
ncbi:MAG: hypothetical protein ABI895_25055 [Deltaproteobacteria bacterium]